MLDGWDHHPQVLAVTQEVSDALGIDIAKLIHDGPKDALALTTNTQPAMLTVAVAAYRVWLAEVGMVPQVVAGHSLGEYSALVASGVLALSDAAPLVRFRAQVMQDAVPLGAGAMAAILGLDAATVIAVCTDVTASFGPQTAEVVEAVNFNDPSQTVIAGSCTAVTQACVALRTSGAKRALALPVSAPFHSRLMRPAAQRLRERLAVTPFAQPQITVINNIDVAIETDADKIRDALMRQACGPVRWVECIQAIRSHGVTTAIECGPGKVLTGLMRRIAPDMQAMALLDRASLNDIHIFLSDSSEGDATKSCLHNDDVRNGGNAR